jgi:hypothetical protein
MPSVGIVLGVYGKRAGRKQKQRKAVAPILSSDKTTRHFGSKEDNDSAGVVNVQFLQHRLVVVQVPKAKLSERHWYSIPAFRLSRRP